MSPPSSAYFPADTKLSTVPTKYEKTSNIADNISDKFSQLTIANKYGEAAGRKKSHDEDKMFFPLENLHFNGELSIIF